MIRRSALKARRIKTGAREAGPLKGYILVSSRQTCRKITEASVRKVNELGRSDSGVAVLLMIQIFRDVTMSPRMSRSRRFDGKISLHGLADSQDSCNCGFESPRGNGYLSVVLCVVRYRTLRRADPSSRGVLPTVVCHCVI